MPVNRDIIIKGIPKVIQCAVIFADTRSVSGYRARVNCSIEPSSKSDRKIVSSDSDVANNAVTQIIHDVSLFNNSESDPNANGNKTITIIKNINGLTSSDLLRKASVKSRCRITKKMFRYSLIIFAQMNMHKRIAINFHRLVRRENHHPSVRAMFNNQLFKYYFAVSIKRIKGFIQ